MWINWLVGYVDQIWEMGIEICSSVESSMWKLKLIR
jgi:hypothetical protein